MTTQDILKRKAAEKAVEYVKSGMVLGFGTGSTFNHVLYILSEKIKSGELKNIVGVPSSEKTVELANKLNVPISTLEEHPQIDLTIDGADEVDNELNLIKGGGGALLREKIIAQASKEYIIIVDETKVSEKLGEKWAVPVEVIKMALPTEKVFLQSSGAVVVQRKNADGSAFVTDEGNYILDANFGIIPEPEKLASALEKRAGIVEHGLFVQMANHVVVAKENEVIVLHK